MDFNRYASVIWSVVSMSAVVNAAVNLATGNIVTSQSSDYNDIWVSSKAVDGCKTQTMSSDCCTHTAEGQLEAWWQVDLQQQSVIQTVEIIYRDENTLQRLAGFEIFLSDNSDWRSGERCYQDNTASLGLMSATQNVACAGVGRYVTIYNDRREKAKTWYSDNAILGLCEVYVYGCILGKFGNGHCNDDCLNCLSNICNPTSGVCSTCAAGYRRSDDVCVPCPLNCAGNTCDGSSGACSDCNDGYYGATCTPCPTGCNTNTCEKTSGICFTGCKAGFFGAYCRCPLNCADQSCPTTGQCSNCNVGYYGATCVQCPTGCSTNTCDKTSGNCNQCKAGLYGNQCNQQCTFTCKDNMCNKNSGQCDDCNDGYYGQSCLACPTGCSTNTCDKTSGRCFDCNDGHYGATCTPCPTGCSTNTCDQMSGGCIECEAGKHGETCDKTCPVNCSSNACYQINGQCSECKAGYYGDFCSYTCPENCQTDRCTMVDGRCNECNPGFYGAFCDQICPDNCQDKICSTDDGNCTVCVPGFYGRSCSQVCPSNCKNNVCNKQDGQCIEQLTDTASDSEHIAIYAVLGTLLGISICCNIGLIVLHLRHSKKMKSSQETSEAGRTNYDSRNYQELDVTKVESVKNVYDTIQ